MDDEEHTTIKWWTCSFRWFHWFHLEVKEQEPSIYLSSMESYKDGVDRKL